MNEKYDIILNTKNLRKVAFAVGFGFAMGKKVAGYAGAFIDGAITGTTQLLAKHGNSTAQDICDKVGVKYDKGHTKDENEVKNKTPIGFHV